MQTLSPTLLRAHQLLDVVLDLGTSTAKPVAARNKCSQSLCKP